MAWSSFFEITSSLIFLIFELAWKSSGILGGVLLLNKFLERQSASLRQSVYSAAIFTMITLMIVAPLLPRWKVFLPAWVSANSLTESVNDVSLDKESSNNDLQSAQRNSDLDASSIIDNQSQRTFENQAGTISINFIAVIESIAVFVWFAVIAILLRRLWKSLFGLRYLRRACSGIQANSELDLLVQDISRKFGCDQSVAVLRHEAAVMPVTWGVLRHFVLLPKGFEALSAECRRAVLTHEMNHIKRRDFIVRVLTEILCAVLWFQPLVWIVRCRLREEQERAADDRVLAAGEKPSAYAKLLLEWNERLPSDSHAPIAAAGIVERSGLSVRINSILNPKLNRRSVRLSEMFTVWLAILALAIPLAALGFSTDVLSNEKISSEIFEPTKNSFYVSDEKLTNGNEPIFQSKNSDERAKIDNEQKSPNKNAFPLPDRSDELTVTNRKPKNETKTIKNDNEKSSTVFSVAPTRKAVKANDSSATLKVSLTDEREATAKPSPPVAESSPGEAHQLVRHVFENIRQGFKNGKKPINIFDP